MNNKLALAPSRLGSAARGFSSWSLVAAAFALFFVIAGLSASSFFVKTGVQAGAAVTVGSVLNEIKELQPRIVTDLAVFKGRAVTYFESGPIGAIAENVAANASENVKSIANSAGVGADLKGLAQNSRIWAAAASWAIFLSLMLGAIMSTYGGIVGGLAQRVVTRAYDQKQNFKNEAPKAA